MFISQVAFWGSVACYCIADEDRLRGEQRRRDAAIDAAATADDDGDDVDDDVEAKAGPFVNKIFEMAVEGAEQKVHQLEDAVGVDVADSILFLSLTNNVKYSFLSGYILRNTTTTAF